MSLLDYLFTGQDETARGETLDAQIEAIRKRDYEPGGSTYERMQQLYSQSEVDRRSQSALDDLKASQTQTVTATGDANYDATHGNQSAAIGGVLYNVLLLGLIGAGIWLFAKIGGYSLVRGIIQKYKWGTAVVSVVFVVLTWFLIKLVSGTVSNAKQASKNTGNAFSTLF